MIIALGESIVVLGVGTEGLELDAGIVVFALLALALNAALWWVYFSDERAVEDAFGDAPAERRPQLALAAFGYWHYGLLLAVIAIAAGLKKAIGHPYDHARRLGRDRARHRHRALHRLRRGLPPDVRAPAQRAQARGRAARAGHDPARHRGRRRRPGRRAGGARGRRLGRSGDGRGVPLDGPRASGVLNGMTSFIKKRRAVVALAIGFTAVPAVALAATDAVPGDPFKLGQSQRIDKASTVLEGTDQLGDGVLSAAQGGPAASGRC